MTTIDFDLGGLNVSISHDLIANPTFDTAPTETALAANVNIRLPWATSQGDWDTMFTYKTVTDDFVDTATSDILYTSDSTGWYTGNLMTDVGVSSGGVAGTGLTSGTRAVQAIPEMPVVENIISKDLLAHIAYEIFGQNLGLDMFSNEATMLADLQKTSSGSCMADIEAAINTLFTTSNTAGLAGTKDSTNFAHHILTGIMAETTDRRDTAVAAYDTDGGQGTDHNVPLIAGDTISFSITIQPTFSASDTNGTGHGIGSQTVRPRIYKVTLVLE
tara:strand:+ start:3441 stop:4262 length:822 start_codon:yes stop_codon:yes gene_type:complete